MFSLCVSFASVQSLAETKDASIELNQIISDDCNNENDQCLSPEEFESLKTESLTVSALGSGLGIGISVIGAFMRSIVMVIKCTNERARCHNFVARRPIMEASYPLVILAGVTLIMTGVGTYVYNHYLTSDLDQAKAALQIKQIRKQIKKQKQSVL